MTLRNNKVSSEELQLHLINFRLCDETILYIGKVEKQFLSIRLDQFFYYKIGRRSPHKGGYWLKCLDNLNQLYVHLIPTNNSHDIEERMLQSFMNNVSKVSRMRLIDKELPLPFANLQLRPGMIKKHGLQNHYS